MGGTPQGHNLDGAIDFMRIARGTLADAKTTIDELYAWEFDGPFLYDFTGRKRPADGGEAGAIDDGVKVRAMKGQEVTISGADLIEGWKRQADGSWSAPLAAEPKKVLRDGQPWSEFRYDKAAKRITVKTGGDPRLHVFETVLREQGIALAGKKDAKIEQIKVADTL